jgi:predicted secreted hydrolase
MSGRPLAGLLTAMVLGGGAAEAMANKVYTEEGYRLPTAGHLFSFPRDHGSHPEFKIEWWYITGHLRVAERPEPFGFQATFFRYALAPRAGSGDGSDFGTNQLYMAHMALADPVGKRFLHEERLNRDGWDASARTDDLAVRNGNWHLRRTTGERMELLGTVEGAVTLRLELAPTKPRVLFGDGGLSRKGSDPSAASWYITFPRLSVTGSLGLDGTAREVSGEAWMDHEISSSQLGANQRGWDWASLRMKDGREIMVYILRTEGGEPDAHSTLAWIDEAGQVSQVGPSGFTWRARRSWTSPETGGTYPIDVDLTTVDPATGQPVTFRLRPLMDAQEMVGHLGGISYWEGACEILDADGGVVGEAYMELTGYAEELGDALK